MKKRIRLFFKHGLLPVLTLTTLCVPLTAASPAPDSLGPAQVVAYFQATSYSMKDTNDLGLTEMTILFLAVLAVLALTLEVKDYLVSRSRAADRVGRRKAKFQPYTTVSSLVVWLSSPTLPELTIQAIKPIYIN